MAHSFCWSWAHPCATVRCAAGSMAQKYCATPAAPAASAATASAAAGATAAPASQPTALPSAVTTPASAAVSASIRSASGGTAAAGGSSAADRWLSTVLNEDAINAISSVVDACYDAADAVQDDVDVKCMLGDVAGALNAFPAVDEALSARTAAGRRTLLSQSRGGARIRHVCNDG